MQYVLITCGFKSIFTADTDAEARAIASQIAIEKNIYAYLVYNRRGDLIASKEKKIMSNLRKQKKKLKKKIVELQYKNLLLSQYIAESEFKIRRVDVRKLMAAMKADEEMPVEYVVECLAREYARSSEFQSILKANMVTEKHPFERAKIYRTHLKIISPEEVIYEERAKADMLLR